MLYRKSDFACHLVPVDRKIRSKDSTDTHTYIHREGFYSASRMAQSAMGRLCGIFSWVTDTWPECRIRWDEIRSSIKRRQRVLRGLWSEERMQMHPDSCNHPSWDTRASFFFSSIFQLRRQKRNYEKGISPLQQTHTHIYILIGRHNKRIWGCNLQLYFSQE